MPDNRLTPVPARIEDLRGNVLFDVASAGHTLIYTGLGWTHGDASTLEVLPAGASTPIDLATLNEYAKNVRHYGATGGGVADDTTPIAAAITAAGAGGTVYVPPGTYRTTSRLLPLSGQVVCGEGREKSKIVLSGSTDMVIEVIGVSNVVIRDLTADGGGNVGNPSIMFDGATDCLVENVRLTGGNWGSLCRAQSSAITFRNVYVSDIGVAHGIELNSSTNCLIDGCRIHVDDPISNAIEMADTLEAEGGSQGDGHKVVNSDLVSEFKSGIKIVGIKNVVVASNKIHDCGGPGVYLQADEVTPFAASDVVTIANNVFADNGGAEGSSGLQVDDTWGVSIGGNVIKGSANNGMQLNNCRNFSISGNVVQANGANGIYVNGGADHVLVANSVYDNVATHGIVLEATDHCLVGMNRCTNRAAAAQYHGIFLIGSTNCTIALNDVEGNANNGVATSGTITGTIIYLNTGDVSTTTLPQSLVTNLATDLAAIVAAAVTVTGIQSIAGVKTFTERIVASDGLSSLTQPLYGSAGVCMGYGDAYGTPGASGHSTLTLYDGAAGATIFETTYVGSYFGYRNRTGAFGFRSDNNGNFVVGAAVLDVAAADGFIYVPTCAGTPTGAPTAYTGSAPIVIDTSGSKIWVRVGGSWKSAPLA